MGRETHRWHNRDWHVDDGIFSYKGLNFYVRTGTTGCSDAGIITNCLDNDDFSYWHYSPYTGIVIDVGAHIGGFTCAVGKMAERVFAYEARKENYRLLVKNKKLNKLTNVICLHRAAGVDGMATLGIDSQYGGSSLINPEGRENESVRGVMLPEMMDGKDEVCLMKLDCEGGEYGLFMNQPKELIRKIKIIASEIHYHPDYKHSDIIDYIRGCGYSGTVRASRADSCKMVNFVRID